MGQKAAQLGEHLAYLDEHPAHGGYVGGEEWGGAVVELVYSVLVPFVVFLDGFEGGFLFGSDDGRVRGGGFGDRLSGWPLPVAVDKEAFVFDCEGCHGIPEN